MVKGWSKTKKYESRYSSLGIYGTVYENKKGDIVWIDSVVGGGGAVFILRKGQSSPNNLFGEGHGFRTQTIANRYAVKWMREHPMG